MNALVRATLVDRERLLQVSDCFVLGVALCLPWSTSATAVLITLWLLAYLPVIDIDDLARELRSLAGGLPVLLWVLAAIGMLWADVGWADRLSGLGGYHRLLVIPLLIARFRRSKYGVVVFYGFLGSTTCLLIVSWIFALVPAFATYGKAYGVPVKDYIWQSGIFLVCAFGLLGYACKYWHAGRSRIVTVLASVAAAFIVNISFIATGRTTLIVAPFLTALLGYRQYAMKGLVAALLISVALTSALWLGSPYLRVRTINSARELHAYLKIDAINSTGLHLEFLRKSALMVADAPIIGHGTGSIADEFRRAAAGATGAAGVVSVNPHDQIFAVAIELGVIGAAVLLAMWAAHFMLFWGKGLTAWIGAIVVVQAVVSSFFNSHIFDFSQGWLYVFGVGVAGGMILKERCPIAQRAAPDVADERPSA